ncbi:MAG: hypothetical protein V3S37_01970 [Dehalococcoidia bacterium]
MAEKYADHVQMLNVYTREPHAGENRFKQYSQHTSYEHKMGYACELVDTDNMKVPVLVDGFDEAVHEQFGRLPNMVYVIDRAGRIVYKSTWTMYDKLEEVLQELKAEDEASMAVSEARQGA